MLKKIKTADLKIGERFSAPVFFDDGKNMFLLKVLFYTHNGNPHFNI